jgi:predicted MFS family arabinose efflux permease
VLLVAFVAWQRRAAHPLLPLSIVLDRNRGAAYASVLIAGAGMFGIFLFVTYYLQGTLGYSPIQTGLSFLPMIGMLVVAAQVGTNFLVPRFGPKILVPAGMTLGVIGMVYLTFLDASSSYAAHVLPALMILGTAMGTIMPASMQTATLGVDRQFAGVASAIVNTSQQVGGSIGTALLNTLAATAAADFVATHAPSAAIGVQAAVHSYATAYWWGAGFFAFGAVFSALVFRRRGQGLSLSHRPVAEATEPVLAA